MAVLNKFQQLNRSVLSPALLSTIKQGNWRNFPAGLIRCKNCGARVSVCNLKFFNWDCEEVLCYECQKLNKFI